MSTEEKIAQLEQRLWKLSSDVASAQYEIRMLQQEINLLKGIERPVLNQDIKFYSTETEPMSSSPDSFENFIGLKLIHLIGIVLLVAGISIGVKYAIDKELISEIMRIVLAYIAGAMLWMIAWRLKKNYAMFSAILFSGSMATFYFTTYAAFVYYSFFTGTVAFLMMVALTAYTVLTAIQYNKQEVAVLGMIGAYGIPILINTNAGRFDLFFSYIFLINIGVVFLSLKKYWKIMAKVAMLITWTLFIGWLFMEYDQSNAFGIALLFLVLYYLLFTVNSLAYSVYQKKPLTAGEIQQIMVNNLVFFIGAEAIYSDKIAAVTGALFVLFAGLSFLVLFFMKKEYLLQSLMAWQSLLLLLLFIFFEFEGLSVTFLWITIAVLLFVWGIFNKKEWFRLASVSVMGLTICKLILFDFSLFTTVQKIIAFVVMGIVLLLGSFYYQKRNILNRDKSND